MKVVKKVEQITVEYDQSDHVYGDINSYKKLGYEKKSSGLNNGVKIQHGLIFYCFFFIC